MRGGAVAGGRRRGRPPDGASCSRRAGLQQCKSFVEMCIVRCLSVSPACVCGRGAATWGCPRRPLPCSRDSPAPLYRTDGGWLSFGWLECRQRTASTQSRCGGGVTTRLRLSGARSGLPCPVPACCCRGRLARAGSGCHSGVEYGGVGPERGLRGGGRRGWCEEWARRGYDHPTSSYH
jgi:hypothetical protein